MFKIESFLSAGPLRNFWASKIRSWHLVALLLSLTAHFLLILFIDGQLSLIREMSSSEPAQASASNHSISIHLVPPDSSAGATEATPNAFVNRTQEIAKPWEPASPPQALLAPPPLPTFEILLPPAPYYFKSKVLSVKPQVLSDIPMDLGATITSAMPGSAIFRLQINEQGEVDQVIVDETSFSESEQRVVLEAFQKMKFAPGKIDDKAVKSELRIEVVVDETIPEISP